MKTIIYFLIGSALFGGLIMGALVVWSPAMAETTRTVDWYKTHSTERAAKLRECRDNPGELRDSPNCVNAEKAAALVEASKKELPVFRPLQGRELWPGGDPWKQQQGQP